MALVLVAVVLATRGEGGRRPAGTRRQSPDYAVMADIEATDTDQMLDAISERRHRTGRRDVGEELADEWLRGTWD